MTGAVTLSIEDYARWLRDKTSIRAISDWAEITTPFLDRHNDYIQLYVKTENGGFLLTDDGYTLTDLEHSGCRLASPKRKAILESTLNGFGVRLHDDVLETRATRDNFPVRKHSLIQAMLAVGDLFYLANPATASIFHEDVASWLDAREIRHSPNVKFTGKTGYDYRFDFLIPKSKKAPERLVQAINSPSRGRANSFMFSWLDTRATRAPDARAYVILNDGDKTIQENVIAAFASYDIETITWSEREGKLELLIA